MKQRTQHPSAVRGGLASCTVVLLVSGLAAGCARHRGVQAVGPDVLQVEGAAPSDPAPPQATTPQAPPASSMPEISAEWLSSSADDVEDPYGPEPVAPAPARTRPTLDDRVAQSDATIRDPWLELADVQRPLSSFRALTADTDPRQARDGVAHAPTDAPEWCTRAFGTDARCRVLTEGPLYVTDLLVTGKSCEGQSLAVLRDGELRLRLEDPGVLHSSRLMLAAGDGLVLVQESAPAGSKAKTDARYACDAYWSGFAPYGVSQSSSVELDLGF